MYFTDLCAGFLVSRDAEGVSRRTLDWYRQQFNAATPALPPIVEEIRRAHIEAFIAGQRQHVSPSTVNARFRALRALFLWAIDRDDEYCVSKSPMQRMKAPKVPDKQQRATSMADYQCLLASISGNEWIDQRDRCILHLLFWCGLRRAELTGMTVGSVDIAKRLITVVGKGGKVRVVPFPTFVAGALLEYLWGRPSWDGPEVWVSNNGAGGIRGALSDEAINLMLARRCRTAGVQKFNPHAFRHGYAMELLNEGDLEMGVLSKLMGHADEATTRRIYAKFRSNRVERDYRRALEKMHVE